MLRSPCSNCSRFRDSLYILGFLPLQLLTSFHSGLAIPDFHFFGDKSHHTTSSVVLRSCEISYHKSRYAFSSKPVVSQCVANGNVCQPYSLGEGKNTNVHHCAFMVYDFLEWILLKHRHFDIRSSCLRTQVTLDYHGHNPQGSADSCSSSRSYPGRRGTNKFLSWGMQLAR